MLGASSLSLSDQEAALLVFGKGDRRVSLTSFPHPSPVLGSGKQVAIDGIAFWIFMQGMYTIIMWSQHGVSYVMVCDEEVDESLEYARLCAQFLRTPI